MLVEGSCPLRVPLAVLPLDINVPLDSHARDKPEEPRGESPEVVRCRLECQ